MNRRNIPKPIDPATQSYPAAYAPATPSYTEPAYAPSGPSVDRSNEGFKSVDASEVGPDMTQAQERTFAGLAIIWLSVLPILAISIVQFGLVKVFEKQECHFSEDESDLQSKAARPSTVMGYLTPGLLLGLFLIPRRLTRSNMFGFIGLTVLLAASVGFAFFFNSSYGNNFAIQSGNEGNDSKIKALISHESGEVIKCSSVYTVISQHVWYCFCALSVCFFLNGFCAYFIDLMSFKINVASALIGLATTVFICGDFATTLHLNAVIGLIAVLFPFLWILRLQMWVSGSVDSSLRLSQTFAGSVALVAEMPLTLWGALIN